MSVIWVECRGCGAIWRFVNDPLRARLFAAGVMRCNCNSWRGTATNEALLVRA